jgi:hypothetical protein
VECPVVMTFHDQVFKGPVELKFQQFVADMVVCSGGEHKKYFILVYFI